MFTSPLPAARKVNAEVSSSGSTVGNQYLRRKSSQSLNRVESTTMPAPSCGASVPACPGAQAERLEGSVGAVIVPEVGGNVRPQKWSGSFAPVGPQAMTAETPDTSGCTGE